MLSLLDLSSPIADVFAFLGPADQHKLRCTSSGMCAWFDSAAENGSLAFFVTFAPGLATGPVRWKHATSTPCGDRQEGFDATKCTPPLQITVTVHSRNYYFSTFNIETNGEADDAIIEKATIRLDDAFPFEHKLVVTGLFGIRSIGDGFCSGVKATEVEFKAEDSQLRSVGGDWMYFSPRLRSVTFSGFTALEEVGEGWMRECSSLNSIAFAGDMPNLTKVGIFWMCSSNVKRVDLTGFTALEEVGDYWLSGCPSLNLTFVGNMPRLKKVGHKWMSHCSKLQRVDLTAFTALEVVGNHWMLGCVSLESIVFAADMPKLRKVGSNWMYSCSKLKHVDLAGFIALEEVGSNCLSYCACLERVVLPAHMSSPQSDCNLITPFPKPFKE